MAPLSSKSLHFKDAFASLNGTLLTLGNRFFTRSIDLAGGNVRTIALTASDGTPWAMENPADADFYFPSDRCPAAEMRYQVTDVSMQIRNACDFDSENLHIVVTVHEGRQQLTFRRDYYIYPEFPGIVMRGRICTPVYPIMLWNHRRIPQEDFQRRARKGLFFEGCVDTLAPAKGFRAEQTVLYHGRTDFCDDQIKKLPADKSKLNGNILFIRDENSERSMLYLQEAPPSDERRDAEDYDFRIGEDGRIFSCSWNLYPGELASPKEFRSPRHVLILSEKRNEEEILLKRYQRLRAPDSFPPITANPWGDQAGEYYNHNTEEFLISEIDAASECGAQVYQLDDSWQAGGVLGDITGRNTKVNAKEFWKISPRLWNGDFSFPAKHAKAKGVELSLWFAPSANIAYRDWREMSEILLDFQTKYGIRHFKLDGMNLTSSEAERNIELLFRTTARKGLRFQIDLTGWGLRQGYFRFTEYGGIFLENRYTHEDGGLGYHPERTWRNVWRLAQYNLLQRFLIEIPAPNRINQDFYRKKGECLPTDYPWEYWIAIALFATPLLWMSPSTTTPEQRKTLRTFLDWKKSHAQDFESAFVHCFGREPDGASISGLYLDGPHPMILVFRERNCTERIVHSPIQINGNWKTVFGKGEIRPDENGDLAIDLPDAASFALLTLN